MVLYNRSKGQEIVKRVGNRIWLREPSRLRRLKKIEKIQKTLLTNSQTYDIISTESEKEKMTNEDNIKLYDTWYLEFLLEKIQKELERRKNKKPIDNPKNL